MSNCRAATCGAPMIFVASAATGRPMALDEAPSPLGNVAIVKGRAVVYRDAAAAVLAGHDPAKLRTDHHATCPAASLFRRAVKRTRRRA